jgi:anti-sigma B factor antagonist
MLVGFSIDVDEDEDVPVLNIKGEIDIYSCPQLRTALSKLIDKGKQTFIINMESIQYIDSTGLGTIAHTAQTVKANDGYIHIICNKPQIVKIFEVSGLQKKNIRLYESETAVMKALN